MKSRMYGGGNKQVKIVFFVKPGLDSFIGEVIEGIRDEYETRKMIISDYNDIDKGMEWADICWFEWCDDLIAYGSRLDIAREKRIICRIHGYEVYSDQILQPNWKNVDEIIFAAPHIKRFFDKHTAEIDMGKITKDIVFCGVDEAKYPFNKKKKSFNIGYLGYINYKKNIPLTLEIFKNLYESDCRYTLYLAGAFQDMRTLEYVKYFIREYNMQSSIFYEGWKNYEEKLEWFKRVEYMLISSIDEGLCYAAAEAMLSGIKPVLHNCEGLKDHYSAKYIFNSVQEAVDMVKAEEYESEEYRDYIIKNYSSSLQAERTKDIITRMLQ